MHFYIRAPKTVSVTPKYRFKLEFPLGIRTSALWEILMVIVGKYDTSALTKLNSIREDCCITQSFGPSMRDILDQHGPIIRSAGSPKEMNMNSKKCNCGSLFPEFLDNGIGHVRTMDTTILPPNLAFMINKGLNFRPWFFKSRSQSQTSACAWAAEVIRRLKHKAIRDNSDSILTEFKQATWPRIRDIDGLNYSSVESDSWVCKHLVICSTDKIAHTASIECIHWYRMVCLKRLRSAAFIKTIFPNMQEKSSLQEFAPWAANSAYKPAILFGMAKQHKRVSDPMAYRWITSACSDMSKPLSDEALRILTFLWEKARNDCGELGTSTGAKYFWSIDSLDIVPLNTDISRQRPDRQPSAFDLEKCFECIPLTNSEHSLISRLSIFLDLVWNEGMHLSSDEHEYIPGPKQTCFWSHGDACHNYDRKRIMSLCEEIMDLAVVTVGDYAARQAVGIPMGFSVSVIFLNIYMFTYEFEFTQRLCKQAPLLVKHTHEIYRYVDDLGNLSDLDLRPYLKDLLCEPDSWDWIYPMAPWGPLSMTDQTERTRDYTKVIYLNQTFILIDGYLSYQWHDKVKVYENLKLPTCIYTHWDSCLSENSKLGTIKSQVRAVIIASSSLELCKEGLLRLYDKFISIGFPNALAQSTIVDAFEQLLPSMPVPYNPTPGVLV